MHLGRACIRVVSGVGPGSSPPWSGELASRGLCAASPVGGGARPDLRTVGTSAEEAVFLFPFLGGWDGVQCFSPTPRNACGGGCRFQTVEGACGARARHPTVRSGNPVGGRRGVPRRACLPPADQGTLPLPARLRGPSRPPGQVITACTHPGRASGRRRPATTSDLYREQLFVRRTWRDEGASVSGSRLCQGDGVSLSSPPSGVCGC